MTKQKLASYIWEQVNKMCSKFDASEYKDYILGFLFYKFLSDKQEKYLKNENYFTEKDISNLIEDDQDAVALCQNGIGYFISYKYLFSTWIKQGIKFEANIVADALNAFDRLIDKKAYKKVFERIFDTLQAGLSKLGDNALTQTQTISGLLHLINKIPMDNEQDYEVLGYIYEYLISNFAVNAGKKTSEFYTPHEVSLMISQIIAYHLKNYKEIKIYDPTCGSGSFLVNIGKCFAKYAKERDKVMYYGQEIIESTYNLARMNLTIRGIIPSNVKVRRGDTLKKDWPFFDESDPAGTYEPLKVDAVVSNPPCFLNWEPDNYELDSRFSGYGLAPKSKADYAFLLHSLFHLKSDGIMAIVLPHGVLFRGGKEGEIRKNLIEKNHIDTIIGLPPNIFFGTRNSAIVMILKQERADDTSVLFIDASKSFFIDASKSFLKSKKNQLSPSGIKKIVDTYIKRKTIVKYSRVVPKAEIVDLQKNNYNLNIKRYVDSTDDTESWDLYALINGDNIPQVEINQMNNFWTVFPNLKAELFENINSNYAKLKCHDIDLVVDNNVDVKKFIKLCQDKFSDFGSLLKKILIADLKDLDLHEKHKTICDEIFDCLELFPLIDKYQVYELFIKEWKRVETDLEIIKTNSDNHKNVIEQIREQQDETFDKLIYEWIFPNEYQKFLDIEKKFYNLNDKYQNIFDSLSDDEKKECNDFLNEEKNNFCDKKIKNYFKEILKEEKLHKIPVEYKIFIICKKIKNQIFDNQEKVVLEKKLLNLDHELRELFKELKDNTSLQFKGIINNKKLTFDKKKVNNYTKQFLNNFDFEKNSVEAKTSRVSWLMKDQENHIKKLKNLHENLENYKNEVKKIFDSFTLKEKNDYYHFFNTDITSIDAKKINEYIEQLYTIENVYEVTFETKILIANHIIESKEIINEQFKNIKTKLQDLTNATIGNLFKEQINMLLEKRWIQSIIDKLFDLPNLIIENLCDEISKLCNKYSKSYSNIEKEINETALIFSSLVDELVGEDFDIKGLKELKKLLA